MIQRVTFFPALSAGLLLAAGGLLPPPPHAASESAATATHATPMRRVRAPVVDHMGGCPLPKVALPLPPDLSVRPEV
jgi:hypothetical protein